MKFSQMDTETGFEWMQKFVPIIAGIIEDPELANAKKALSSATGAEVMVMITPILLKKHKADIVELVAAMQGVAVELVKNQPITETVETLAEGVKLFATFFPASLHLVATA